MAGKFSDLELSQLAEAKQREITERTQREAAESNKRWAEREQARLAELDQLRDLRALVLRHAALNPREINRGRWAEVVKAARAAMTPETFKPDTPEAPQ